LAETKPWAIGIVILCTVFTSLGALLLKKGITKFSFSITGILDAYLLFVGLFFYFIGFVLLTTAFRHGELSVLFPFVSLSFVWVAILSAVFLSEQINIFEIIGVASIILGVIMIGTSGKKKMALRG
jgi:drug/metabolite transporter (DMT)-like permease